jgi:FKBP-type peptidyl-prolyl cis-trans isomerase FkpA
MLGSFGQWARNFNQTENYMKNQRIAWIVIFGVLAFLGCGESGKTGAGPEPSLDTDSSYALGMDIGASLKQSGISPEYEAFVQGMRDVLEDQDTRFTQEEAMEKLQTAFVAAMQKQNEDRRQAEAEFLAETGKKPGVTITESGLQYEVIAQGTGARPGPADTVRVNYEGTFSDGRVFDSSYARGEPTEFPLSGVIPGWTEGIQLMSEGATYKFYIPSDLGYGPNGSGPIPPYSPLTFKVELIAVVK